jgi:hypothetical protein
MAAPNGASIFPLALIPGPQPAEFFVDNLNQLLELIASQVAPASAAATSTGTFTANGATAVTVANTNVDANSIISITLKTVGGTPAAVPYLATITPGTGFTVKAAAGDTSVYNYNIVG